MRLNPTAFLLASLLGTLLVTTGAIAQSSKKNPKKGARSQTALSTSSDVTIQYNFTDLEEAKTWFDILLRENPGTVEPDNSTVTYKVGTTTLILKKADITDSELDEEPVIFFEVDPAAINTVFETLSDPRYDTKVLWNLHKVDSGIQVGALQYRRARVGVISNPPFILGR